MPVSEQGIVDSSGKLQMSWDDLNKIDHDKGNVADKTNQKQILLQAGVPADQVEQFMTALQGMEIAEYKQSQAKQDFEKHHGVFKALSGIPVLGGISKQVSETAADLSGGLLGGKELMRN